MTISAMIFMSAVWTVTAVATGYCFYKLLTSKRRLDSDDQ